MTGMQFHAGDNYLSKLNTLTKLTITLFFSVLIVFVKNETALFILFGASVFYVAPLKRWKAMVIGYGIILFMYLSSILFSALLGLIADRFGAKENFQMLVPFLRVSFMINLSLALTLSSGVRRLTNVLKTLKLPRFIFLPTIVVFRFVPSFMNDIKQIHQNIKLRMGNPNLGMMITRPRLFIRLMIVPAVVRALRSAEELSVAAELKGIDGVDNMINSTPELWSWRDTVAFSLSLVLAATVLYFSMEAV
ncbi:MAG: energy-coupling factor transporter transmembrane protein EcfT [Candidatus Sabulitectum sp.]|nr:energy-coupling factor transporter transmembrane protein EcfT [Candidatus Sabulitectum sp.]